MRWLARAFGLWCLACSALAAPDFPPTHQMDGRALVLNGAGVRNYGVFKVQVYEAALYLVTRDARAEAVLNAPTPKALQMRFLRSASLEDTRAAWLHYLESNCKPPCPWPESGVRQLMALLPPTVQGDTQTWWFRPEGLELLRNGQTLGRVNNPQLARLALASWIGEVPTTPALKRALLGEKP